jgi:hypothetical protein
MSFPIGSYVKLSSPPAVIFDQTRPTRRNCEMGPSNDYYDKVWKLWLIKAMWEFFYFVPSIWYLVPTTYYVVPTRKIVCSHSILSCSLNILFCSHNILSRFPQDIILFPQESYFVPTRKIFCSLNILFRSHNISSLHCTVGVMVSVHASSAVDRGFESWSGQTKHFKIGESVSECVIVD